jgi:hypothetical protein
LNINDMADFSTIDDALCGKGVKMLTITNYSADLVKDPFGILSGKRYEFLLDVEVPEDDELYSENGIFARVIFKAEENQTGIVSYDLIEKTTNRVLEFDMEADEEAALAEFCKEHLPE